MAEVGSRPQDKKMSTLTLASVPMVGHCYYKYIGLALYFGSKSSALHCTKLTNSGNKIQNQHITVLYEISLGFTLKEETKPEPESLFLIWGPILPYISLPTHPLPHPYLSRPECWPPSQYHNPFDTIVVEDVSQDLMRYNIPR